MCITPDGSNDLSDDNLSNLYSKFPPQIMNEWEEMSSERVYTPNNDDIGRCLRLECWPIIKNNNNNSIGKIHRIETSAVIPSPQPPPPRNIIYNLKLL